MPKMDISRWIEFRIVDLFRQERGKESSPNRVEDGDLPMVNEINTNNGVAKMGKSSSVILGNCVTVSVNYATNVFYQKDDFCASVNILVLRSVNINEYSGKFIAGLLSRNNLKYDYTNKISKDRLNAETLKLPSDANGAPDWKYMEDYMRNIEVRVSDSLSKLKSAKDVERSKLGISGWNEFCLSDLFTKKTMRGYPSARADCIPDEKGHYVYGQNIKRQMDKPVMLDSQYLHQVDSNHPILAYTSSVCEIGMIDEDFYRSGDNGAFQGLFPINKTLNRYHLQFVLSVLQPIFAQFRYDTSMSDTMSLKFKLPIDFNGEPDWLYMENYMKALETKVKGFLDKTA